MRYFNRDSEPADIYAELVVASYTLLVPVAIMAVIFLGVGVFCAQLVGGVGPKLAVLAGLLTSLGRLGVIIMFRRRGGAREKNPARLAAWELRLALTTILFAAALGMLGWACFTSRIPIAQLLATGLLFGFCSGVLARGYIRPRVCASCITVATAPMVLATILEGGTGYWIMAGLFMAFLIGGYQIIRYTYQQTRDQIALRDRMTLVARKDHLTGLVNRFGLGEAFVDLLRTHGEVPMMAVHCIDLDRFKPVNDRYGHPTGDALLRQMADRIRATIRVGDIAARMGGDEFAIIQAGIGHAEEAEMFARRLIRALSAPYAIGEHIVEIGASLGYVTSPPATGSLHALLAAADAVLYRVKKTGGGVGSNLAEPRGTRVAGVSG